MRYLFLFVVLLTLGMGTITAEDGPVIDTTAQEKDPKTEKIERLFELSGAEDQFKLGQIEGFKSGLDMAQVPIPEKKREQIIKLGKEVMEEVMAWSEIKQDMIKIYAAVYSEEELDRVLKILANKDVQLMLEKQRALIGPSLKIGTKYGQRMIPILMKRMQELE